METILLEASLRVVLIAAGVGCVLAALRIRGAAARHQAWSGALLAMLLTPLWSAYGPKISAPLLPAARTEWISELRIPGQIPNSSVPPVVESPKRASTASSAGVAPALVQPKRPWNWRRIFLAVYLMGFGLMFIRLLWGTQRARRIVKDAVSDDLALVSRECAVPATIGWIRPKIIFPTEWRSWPAEKLDAIQTHEREHLRRRDPLTQWLALLNRAIFWFHPIAWWLERKLSVLSEQACDDEVIRQGLPREDYAQVLLELAQAVTSAGGRLRISGSAIDGGGLRGRIERILDARPMSPLSGSRAFASATLCLIVLMVFLSCKLERKPGLAPGQLSMNELMHLEAAKRQKATTEFDAWNKTVNELTPAGAQELIDELKANPGDEQKHFLLIRYYQRIVNVKGLNSLALWYIEHAPDQRWMQKINPEWDREGYERGKQLWMARLKRRGSSASIYHNAARYLTGGDKPLAEQILLAGQKNYPAEDWAWDFAALYAHTLLGGMGPTTEENIIPKYSMEEAHGPYARSVRAKLADSTNPNILFRTAEMMFAWGGSVDCNARQSVIDFDVIALAQSYCERAIAIRPEYFPAREWKFRFDQIIRGRRISSTPPDHISVSDRMWLLRNQIDNEWRKENIAASESKAKELRALAAQHPNELEYGNAIFCANFKLSAVELKKGNKKEAARYLLETTRAPITDELRYEYIQMNLLRDLIDWGEREAVAKFLDHCAQFNLDGKRMSEWASQIRRGINPPLMPYSS